MLHAFIDFQQNWNMRDNDWLGESYNKTKFTCFRNTFQIIYTV